MYCDFCEIQAAESTPLKAQEQKGENHADEKDERNQFPDYGQALFAENFI